MLAQRLADLERLGLIEKRPDAADGRRSRYLLTASGRAAMPIVYELNRWGTCTNPQTDSAPAILEALALPRATVTDAWALALEHGDSFLFGDMSVVTQLGLTAP